MDIFLNVYFIIILLNCMKSFAGSLWSSESSLTVSGGVVGHGILTQIGSDHVELTLKYNLNLTLISTFENTFPVWIPTTDPTISGVMMQFLRWVLTATGLVPTSVHSLLDFLTLIMKRVYLCLRPLANLLLYLAGNKSTICSLDNASKASMSLPL